MQLEQMTGYQPLALQQRQTTYFVVGDLESLSTSVLYSGDAPIIRPDGMIVPLKIGGIPIHDTYKIDKKGNVSNGHSTVNLPSSGKIYMPHGGGAPSIRIGS